MNDFGEGWSTPYNVGVSDQYPGNYGTSYPKNVFFDNGACIQFVVPSAPTASTPQVQCTPYQNGQPLGGVPFLIYANYGANGNFYSIVWNDRTQWITNTATTISNVYGGTNAGSGGNVYPLAQIIDRNGHAITFNYGPAAGGDFAGATYQWPLLSSITNQDGTALLTIVRVQDGTGAIAAVYDCYGRSVLYHVGLYANHSGNDSISGLPSGQVLYGELDHVSQLVATGAGSAPDRYAYGYENYGYGWTFLHTISVPNPTGGSTSSAATINYDATYQTVTSIVDANGNTTSFATVDVTGTGGGSATPGSSGAPGGTLTATAEPDGTSTNYTQVTVSQGGSVEYTSISGYDNNMDDATETDGAGRVTMSKTFSSTSPDPFAPTSESDGNGNVTQYTYDQYGNVLTQTSPRGTVTTNTYSYANFALGELTKTQVGSKTSTTYAYNEPSGLVSSINKPQPGTSGTGATVTHSFQYDGFGDITSITTPGNNAASSITTAFNYGSSPAIGQILSAMDALGHTTSFTYDAQGNKTSMTDAAENTTFYGNTNGVGGYNWTEPLIPDRAQSQLLPD